MARPNFWMGTIPWTCPVLWEMFRLSREILSNLCGNLVAQCSATPATVVATPPGSATPFQTQVSVRHLPAHGGGRCDTKISRGCSATPVLHLQNALKSRKSAATRVARQGVPAKGVFGKGSFRNLCAELCFVFFCVLRWFSPANLTEISFRNCPSNAGIFWKTPSRKTPKRSCWWKYTSIRSGRPGCPGNRLQTVPGHFWGALATKLPSVFFVYHQHQNFCNTKKNRARN